MNAEPSTDITTIVSTVSVSCRVNRPGIYLLHSARQAIGAGVLMPACRRDELHSDIGRVAGDDLMTIRRRRDTMCVKQLIRSLRLVPALLVAMWCLWLFVNRTQNARSQGLRAAPLPYQDRPYRGPANAASSVILTEARDINRVYPGPYHRYSLVDGKWQRMNQQTVSKPPKPYRIPHIIHQYWETEKIPERFVPWVLSWVKNHPKWEYWLWLPHDAKELIQKNYPKYTKTYELYRMALSRADAARYFILHTYGGVYADLDTESLRPLDDLVDQNSCLLSEETHEHAYLLYFRHPANLITTIMACEPWHPIFLVSVRALPYTQQRYPNNVLKSTGPFFLDSIYRYYVNRSVDIQSIRILPPEYLLPTYDASQSYSFERACMNLRENSPAYLRDVCMRWDNERRLVNKPSDKSYAVHYWIHIIMKEKHWKLTKAMDIELVLNISSKAVKSRGSHKVKL